MAFCGFFIWSFFALSIFSGDAGMVVVVVEVEVKWYMGNIFFFLVGRMADGLVGKSSPMLYCSSSLYLLYTYLYITLGGGGGIHD
jgi:hypothetical protein